MVYAETGTLPVDIVIKTRMVSYWLNIVQGNRSKLCFKIYSILLQLYNNNVYKCSWISKIHRILDECGFSHVWFNHGNMEATTVKRLVKLRLKDQFVQKWNNDINSSSKCCIYKSYKDCLELEDYLVRLPTSASKYILKFRLCNHKLAVETGRYNNIERHRRFCDFCDQDQLGDEYHTLLECKNQNIVQLRERYIPRYYRNNPNMIKFSELVRKCCCKPANVKLAINLSKFLKESQVV
jgi:hypothetical protein